MPAQVLLSPPIEKRETTRCRGPISGLENLLQLHSYQSWPRQLSLSNQERCQTGSKSCSMLGMLIWTLVGLAFPERKLALLPAFTVALYSAYQVPLLFAARVLGLHLLAALACWFFWKNRDLLFFLFAQLFLLSGFWAYHQYFGQDTLSGWVVLMVAPPAIYFRSLSALGAGWLVVGALEFYATPSWLRIAPSLPPLDLHPGLPFQPLAMGALGLLTAALAVRKSHPALVLLPLLGALPLTPANPESVLTHQRVGALVKMPRLQAGRLPQLEAQLTELTEPAWLAYSNNPENIRSLTQPVEVLFRQRLPQGRGRLFASHFNTTGRPLELVLQFSNLQTSPVEIKFEPSPIADPSEVGVYDDWRLQSTTLEPDQSRRFRLRIPLGNGRLLTEVRLSGEVEMTLAMSEPGFAGELSAPPTQRQGSQSRGLFGGPSRRLQAAVELDGQARVLTLDRDWLTSAEGDVLVGNYAVDTQVELSLRPGRHEHCLILLVPSGGWAGSGGHCLHAYSGLVLFNGSVPSFSYRHHLTTNSYAPTRLLVVPY